MWSITRGMMQRSRRTLVPAGIAIAIGSLFICATLLLGNVLDATSTKSFTAAFGGADYAVSVNEGNDAATNLDTDGTTLLHTLKNTHMDQIGSVQGVGDTRYSHLQYDAVASGSDKRMMEIIEVSAHGSIMPVDLTQGAWPSKAGEVAIDEAAANALKVSVGSTLTVGGSTDEIATGAASSDDAAADGTIAGSPETLVPTTFQATVTGITHDTNDQYSLGGGSLVVAPDDLLTLYKADAAGSNPNAASLTHADMPAETVYYSVAKGANAKDVRSAVDASLSGAKVTSRQEAADEYLRQMNGGSINPITAAILAFGVLAMFVAALVIANTFRVLVSQRRRTLALLRTIGASKRQIHRSVLTEGALLGFEYSALGTALACLIVWVMDLANVEFGGEPVRFIPSAVAILMPIAFSTLITLLASTGAARSATMVSPMEALRPIDTTEKRSIKAARAVFSVLLLVIGIALAARAISQVQYFSNNPSALSTTDTTAMVMPLVCAILAAMLTFIGLALSAQVWVPWVLAGLGKLASLIGGASGTIAAANIRKNPRRVAATSTALLIGVTLVATVATGASCATATVNKLLDNHYTVDASVTTTADADTALAAVKDVDGVNSAVSVPRYAVQGFKDANGLAQFYGTAYVVPDSSIGKEVADVFGTKQLKDGVVYLTSDYKNAAMGSSFTGTITDGQQVDLTFKAAKSENFYLGVYEGTAQFGGSGRYDEPATGDDEASDTEASTDTADTDTASADADSNTADSTDATASADAAGSADATDSSSSLASGDEDYNVAPPSTDKTLTVHLADFNITSATGASMVISQSTAKSLGLEPQSSEVWMDLDTSRSTGELIDNLQKATDTLPQAQLQGSFVTRAMFNKVISIAMFTFFALLSAALLIALVGVANTLSLSVIERQRESATLRAIGMTAGQLRASLAWEAVLISIGAGIVGIIIGAFYGWMGSITLFVGTHVVAAPNWPAYLGVLLLALVAALLASIAPARRAIKVPPVEALAEAD